MNALSKTIVICLMLLRIHEGYGQEKNAVIWPYDGTLDSSRYDEYSMKDVPINFNIAVFDSVTFEYAANLKRAYFGNPATFSYVQFMSQANFEKAQFKDHADFNHAKFKCRANFSQSKFQKSANFMISQFNLLADFRFAVFKGKANFTGTLFNQLADFQFTSFDSLADFEFTIFNDDVNFHNTVFPVINLKKAMVYKDIIIGSGKEQYFDFRRTLFSPDSKIILYDLVKLNIQPEKIKLIRLYDKLNFGTKRLVIDHLKQYSFHDNKKALMELEFLFAKSTMYRDWVDEYKHHKWHNIWKWPKWSLKSIYCLTMGLGFRPFRLLYWSALAIILFTLFYVFKMQDQINQYIYKDEQKLTADRKRSKHLQIRQEFRFTDSLINCLYFSTMVFFTFRLTKEILVFFNTKDKRIIVIEWILGFSVYIALLMFSKSGSIFLTLSSLFGG